MVSIAISILVLTAAFVSYSMIRETRSIFGVLVHLVSHVFRHFMMMQLLTTYVILIHTLEIRFASLNWVLRFVSLIPLTSVIKCSIF